MFDTRDLSSLLSVVTEGTFDAAARSLHVTPGAMSQRIKRLEDKVGQLLVLRTQPARPTLAGETLLRLAQQVNLLCSEAALELGQQQESASRVLTVAVNHDSLATWFMDVAGRYSGNRDRLDIRCVDLARTDRLLHDGTAIAAVTSLPVATQGCTCHRLGAQAYEAVASPEFFKQWFADGLTAKALETAPFVAFDRTDTIEREIFTKRYVKGAVDPPSHYVPSTHEIATAVRVGMGWALLPALMVKEDIDRGTLILLPAKTPVVRRVYWHVWSVDAVQVRRLTSVVLSVAKQSLVRHGP